MIIVTGGAGFVGSNLVWQLNSQGEDAILVVDNLSDEKSEAKKFSNLVGSRFVDYMDKAEFRKAIADHQFAGCRIDAILHQGACSNTLEDNGRYMMDNNFTYSKELLHFAVSRGIPFVYASTAAVYGLSKDFREDAGNERPLNIYAFSKLAFDNYVRRHFSEFKSTVVGLRYFNVYGKRELHKGRMASVVHQFKNQAGETGIIRMFEGSGGFAAGEQRRDFVFVEDITRINLFFAFGKVQQAILNAGTGKSRSFNDVAQTLIRLHGSARIEYIPFPDDLRSRYQHFTEADMSGLRSAGYTAPLTELEDGIRQTFTA
jgi:ADP-L-glycero-D-manno-heptose 6-epimerase